MPTDFEVGYKKPPRHSRFRKGQSGNPNGRPKGTRNLRTLAEKELNQRIVIREGGIERRISKGEALVKAQYNKAIKGDTRAAGFVHQVLSAAKGIPEQDATDVPLTPEEEEILQRLLREGPNTAPKDERGSDDC